MPKTTITLQSSIDDSPRVQQIAGIFDLWTAGTHRLNKTSSQSWNVNLPIEEKPWNIGLIVGPSGCGKSTIAARLWPNEYSAGTKRWDPAQSILDAFPDIPVKSLVELLCSVGFSSPPSWLRPYQFLSTGEQFRVSLALALAHNKILTVFDEFTSVVDRNVAKIASAALAKCVRRRNSRFIAVTCHQDVEKWLQPDWVYKPAEQLFAWRSLQQPPHIKIAIFRCSPRAWQLFAPHHYLSGHISSSAWCWLALWDKLPVAFSAWVQFLGPSISPKGARREHRTVTLPDFQGAGIGNRLSNTIASMWTGLGFQATSTTSHPAMISSRSRSPLWSLTRYPALGKKNEGQLKHSMTRLTAGFRFIGPPMQPDIAALLLGL